MKLTLWRDEAVLRRPVVAAHQSHGVRSRLFLRIEHDGVIGFGEVAPQPTALHGDPGVDEVIEELTRVTIPQVCAAFVREGSVPSWTRLARFAGARPASAVAVALVEMAVLDRELRASRLDALTLWPRRFNTPTQATVSLLELGERWSIGGDVARVRAKTSPGTLSAEALERLGELGVPVLLDFNCSASSDADVLDQVAQVASVATLSAVEQPFAAGNVIDHSSLAEQLSVPVSLDEGVRNLRDLGQIARYAAAGVVCVKPARVGGVANARTMVLKAQTLGLRPYLGGFFESPFARHVHRLLAENCVSEASDLGTVAVEAAGDHPEMALSRAGFGVAPSPELLAAATVIYQEG
jgi:L-alanine-DL-glutamate epimerase-like enolase superfamily enzyme